MDKPVCRCYRREELQEEQFKQAFSSQQKIQRTFAPVEANNG